MYELFYIVEVHPQWYNLILKNTHYCVACGDDLESMTEVIYKYVRKFKIPERVYRSISTLEDRGLVPPRTLERRQVDYDLGKHLPFNYLVREMVEKAIKDNRQDTPYNRTKKKVRVVTPLADSTPEPPQETKRVGLVTPLKIRRITPTGN